jgi:transcription antitermination factor NusG
MITRKWFIVETECGRESRATEALREARYRVYMPVMKKTIIHHRTKEPINKRFKLFNRYLFVSLDPGNMDFGSIRACKGVVKVLGIQLDGHPCEINRDVVKRFMLAQRRGDFDDITLLTRKQMAGKVPLGTSIRVRPEHSFGGFYGQVTKIKGRGVITAGLEMFNRLVHVDLGTGDFDMIVRKVAA